MRVVRQMSCAGPFTKRGLNLPSLDYLPTTMLLRTPSQKSGFVEPCRPSKAARPSGPGGSNEIKHDGFWLMIRREGARVRCFTRGGYDWAGRFHPL